MDDWKALLIPTLTAILGGAGVKFFEWLTARSDVNMKAQAAAAQADLDRDKFTIETAFELIERLQARQTQLEAENEKLRALVVKQDGTILELQGQIRRMAYEHETTIAELNRLKVLLAQMQDDGK